jgi:putative ABC transport system permease protein
MRGTNTNIVRRTYQMALWREITRGVRALAHRREADRDIADEVQHYLDEAKAAHVSRGLSPNDALRAARLELGGETIVNEQVRQYGWENLVVTVAADLRYATRRLRSAPAFTTIVVLTIALGIGATTAIFSAVKPILFEPLPYPQPRQVAMVAELSTNGSRNDGSFGMYHTLSERSRSFESIAVLRTWRPTLTGTDHAERLEGQRVSARYFHVLGVAPSLGRDFSQSDDRLNGPLQVILSDALWHRRFAADSSIIGHVVALDDNSYEVIGVMPRTFDNVLAPSADVWSLLQLDMARGYPWGHNVRTIGRLRDGVSAEQASRDVDLTGRAVLAEQHPDSYDPHVRFAVIPLGDDLVRSVKPALLVIVGAVMLVLVIACVNVTNLLLGRGVQRSGEFALRTALGAGRTRLVQQLLTESLLLAAIGGVLGMGVAQLGVRGLVALSPPGLARVGAIHLDATALVFGVVVSTVIGVVVGLIPALRASHSAPQDALQRSTQRATGGHRRMRNALVVAEVAIALVLLVSSGLLFRSLDRLFAVPIGFDSSHLLTLEVQSVGHRFDKDSVRHAFFTQALDAVRRVPGVEAAALTSQLPLSGDADEYGARFDANAKSGHSSYRYSVSPGFFETMGIPLRGGRYLDENDRAGAPPVAVISEALARSGFPGESPLGKRLFIGAASEYTIVGVVGDLKQLSLAGSQSEAVYTTTMQWSSEDAAQSLVVRTSGNAAALAPAVRSAVWSIDKDQPIVRVATMDDLLASTTADRRFALTLFEVFAVAAIVLAAAGIYGVLAGGVAERTREIGVRSALGASRRDIVALILREGMTLTAFGVVIGVVGAIAATRSLTAMLFGVSRLDPMTYVGVVALLAGVSAIACLLPAWRAAHIEPATTLRSE